MKKSHSASAKPSMPLSLMPCGTDVTIESLDHAIDPSQREFLASYGISPGRSVRVIQQKPMTVVIAEDMEVAFEGVISRHVWVVES